MKVPAHGKGYRPAAKSMVGITVYALKENKRPVGFAPWPEEKQEPAQPQEPLSPKFSLGWWRFW